MYNVLEGITNSLSRRGGGIVNTKFTLPQSHSFERNVLHGIYKSLICIQPGFFHSQLKGNFVLLQEVNEPYSYWIHSMRMNRASKTFPATKFLTSLKKTLLGYRRIAEALHSALYDDDTGRLKAIQPTPTQKSKKLVPSNSKEVPLNSNETDKTGDYLQLIEIEVLKTLSPFPPDDSFKDSGEVPDKAAELQ